MGHAPSVQIGRFTRSSVRPGLLHFAVALDARARRALRRRRDLAITVKVILTPASGGPSTVVVRSITDHA
jgi:hypothetical protein